LKQSNLPQPHDLFLDPTLHIDGLARNKSCGCGRFDCFKSRRVEIQFLLKDQNSSQGSFKALAEKLEKQKKGEEDVGH
jgi:hypothetical protein